MAAEGDQTYVTAALPPDMLQRLEDILDSAMRTHPDADPQAIIDVVMCAGIEAVQGNARSAVSTACAQRDTYRTALRKIAALRPGAGNSKLHRAIEIANAAILESRA